MKRKRASDKKQKKLSIIPPLLSKKIEIKSLKVPPMFSFDKTKKKIGNFYSKYKKEKEREKARAENNRKLEAKRELLRQKKLAQKERLEKKKRRKKTNFSSTKTHYR